MKVDYVVPPRFAHVFAGFRRDLAAIMAEEATRPVRLAQLKHYCTVEGCDRLNHARGLCGKHYIKARRGGEAA